MTDLNRRFAELVGLCWHGVKNYAIVEDHRVKEPPKCLCGKTTLSDARLDTHIKSNNPDFVSHPRLVLREMDRIGKLDDFKKYSGVFIWMPEGHYIRVDYIADNTTGLLVKAAIELFEEGENSMIYTASELDAYDLLGKAGRLLNYNTTFCKETPHTAGNRIIGMAEQIKAERAVVVMEIKP